jgi:hypothetical protein
MKKLVLLTLSFAVIMGTAFAADDFLNSGTPPAADLINLVKE